VRKETVNRVRGPYPLADDDPRWRHGPKEIVESAIRAGISVVQLRLKQGTDREALALARWASVRARYSETLLVVNDRYDLADLAGAGGLHLGADDLPPEQVPAELRERLVIGLSTHTLKQVRESRTRPIDYVAFGPVFGTASKETGYGARGVDTLTEAVRIAGHPVVAIGGVSPENVGAVRRAGASAFAVISAVADAEDPAQALRELRSRFEKEGN
jgi:thiamine-phosphate pyrophosphorylase